jgi:predicted RNase H-like nuclease (RuvC/YqgF family)
MAAVLGVLLLPVVASAQSDPLKDFLREREKQDQQRETERLQKRLEDLERAFKNLEWSHQMMERRLDEIERNWNSPVFGPRYKK